MDERQLSLSVTGMTCAACVASVERVLSDVDGVASVSVALRWVNSAGAALWLLHSSASWLRPCTATASAPAGLGRL